ncbi:hypothetical protein D1BOALGB6SA_2980 [Olavius sp. associated proteobacterium Delta 1]|nr:hypothetical protein D1BOALGB6SA_2980 [Olavius sp. associated proteobacterium Delta 1]
MGISKSLRRKAFLIGSLLVALLITGCAGISPYEPRDDREEGPEKGLFTGSEGEFVIYRKADEPETGSEAGKRSDETTDIEQQKMSSEEKKAKIKSDEQQP